MKFNIKKILPVAIPMLCAALVISSMAITGKIIKNKDAVNQTTTAEITTEKKLKNSTVSLVAVGDNLIHNTLINAGKQADGTYNYDSFYENISSDIKSADIAVINQETMLGGDVAQYSGYPLFNTPWEVGEAVINAGFDVILNASNHSMDVGSKGVLNAIKFYEQYPKITYLGINKNNAEHKSIKIVEKNDIKIAMLNYTFGTNGIKLPEDKPWLIDVIDKEKMKTDIETAKKQADVVIVFPHWGTEYSTSISSYQEDLAKFFADNGVDIVIGAHPHVIEPIQEIPRADGGKTLIYYSLGNFISHQNGTEKMLGAMANIKIKKSESGIEITGDAIPLVTHIEKKGTDSWAFSVYKLSDYTPALAKSHKENNFSIEALNKLANDILGDFISSN